MATPRPRPQLTQETDVASPRPLGSLFEAADARERAIYRVKIIPAIVDSDNETYTPALKYKHVLAALGPGHIPKTHNSVPREFYQHWDIVEVLFAP
eukprot:jgi/Phyca11/107785/e_gw1.14.848.1